MDWYISKDSAKQGPYSEAQVHALLTAGRLAPGDLAWRFGLASWTPIRRIADLHALPPTLNCPIIELVEAIDVDPRVNGLARPRSISQLISYCARHWRGELSLPVSFWINGNLTSLALATLVIAVAFTDAANEAPRWFSAAGVAYWLLLTLMSFWQLVGIWRCAANHLNAGKSTLWARLAQGSVILGALGSIYTLGTVGVPQTIEFAQLAAGHDPIGTYQLRLLRDATELEISGAITFGLTQDVAGALAANPKVKILHLNSYGGRVGEARRLRNLIAARRLSTFTAAGCFSACTLAFVAGERRLIARSASLGFHQYAFPGVDQSAFRRQYEKDKSDWLARGIDGAFVERAFATPHEGLWRPEHNELFSAGFVTAYPDGNLADASNGAGGESATLESQLSKHIVFAALKEHEPAVYRRIVAEVQNGIKAGRHQAELSETLLPLVDSVYRDKLPNASDQALLRFTDLFIEQMRALHEADPILCYEYLYRPGDQSRAKSNKSFSKELKDKEMAVMAEVIRSSSTHSQAALPKQQVREPLTSVLDDLTERYGGDVALLGKPIEGKSDPAKMCVMTQALYQKIRQLPEDKSAMVLRFMFAKAK
jgi:GYF domain 2